MRNQANRRRIVSIKKHLKVYDRKPRNDKLVMTNFLLVDIKNDIKKDERDKIKDQERVLDSYYNVVNDLDFRQHIDKNVNIRTLVVENGTFNMKPDENITELFRSSLTTSHIGQKVNRITWFKNGVIKEGHLRNLLVNKLF